MGGLPIGSCDQPRCDGIEASIGGESRAAAEIEPKLGQAQLTGFRSVDGVQFALTQCQGAL